MASWATVPALRGFHYSGVEPTLEFASADHARQLFWANGYAWGTCALEPAADGAQIALTVMHGTLTLRQLRLADVGASTL